MRKPLQRIDCLQELLPAEKGLNIGLRLSPKRQGAFQERFALTRQKIALSSGITGSRGFNKLLSLQKRDVPDQRRAIHGQSFRQFTCGLIARLHDGHKDRELACGHPDLSGQPIVVTADCPRRLSCVVEDTKREVILFHMLLCAYTHQMSSFLIPNTNPRECHQYFAFSCEAVTVPKQPEREEVKMADAVQAVEDMKAKIQENWGWFLVLGVALVIGGIILIAAPLATSIAVTFLIAAVFIIGGLVQVYNAFKTQGTSSFLWNLITGIIAVIGGILIYVNPIVGAFTLTLLLAAIFAAQGFSQILLAFKLKPHEGWVWVLVAGIVSLAAGVMIWIDLPGSATWALGLIAGVSVLVNGWSYIAIALAARASKG